MTSSADRAMAPLSTRQAPSARAAAAPQAMALSVMPRASTLVPSTRMVLRNTDCALSFKVAPRAPLWPNAFSVARPCTESRNSAAKSA